MGNASNCWAVLFFDQCIICGTPLFWVTWQKPMWLVFSRKLIAETQTTQGNFLNSGLLNNLREKNSRATKKLISRKDVDLSPFQFEFLKKYSTIDGLLLPTETISMGRDDNNVVTATFISFSKALDSTSSDLFCKYLWPPTLIINQFYWTCFWLDGFKNFVSKSQLWFVSRCSFH